MKRMPIYLLLLGMGLLIAVAACLCLLPWIPTWLTARRIGFFVCMGGFAILSIFLLRRIWTMTESYMRRRFRMVLIAGLGGFMVILSTGYGFLYRGFLYWKPIMVVHHGTYEFPEYGVTVYSFLWQASLDPITVYSYRGGTLPFQEHLDLLHEGFPEDTPLTQAGEWAENPYVRIHLPTGRAENLY